MKLQVRGELFNLFNHPNFTNPPATLGNIVSSGTYTPNSSFGTSTSMLATSFASGGFSALYQPGGPRSVQLSLRLSF